MAPAPLPVFLAHDDQVFDAIRYLFVSGYVHTAISLQSIRVSSNKHYVVLGEMATMKLCWAPLTAPADFDNCKKVGDVSSQVDLDALASVLITCMDKGPQTALEVAPHVQFVREQRAKSQVFGIGAPERWSGSKQLVDFLDDLLNAGKAPQAKLERAVSMLRAVAREGSIDTRHSILLFRERDGLIHGLCRRLWS